jgi:hypothetical protein
MTSAMVKAARSKGKISIDTSEARRSRNDPKSDTALREKAASKGRKLAADHAKKKVKKGWGAPGRELTDDELDGIVGGLSTSG